MSWGVLGFRVTGGANAGEIAGEMGPEIGEGIRTQGSGFVELITLFGFR